MLKTATFMGSFALSFALAAPINAEDVKASAVVASVNGVEITLGEMIIARAQLPQQYESFPDDVLFRGILDQLIQQELLSTGVNPVPARVDYAVTNERRALLAGEFVNNITTQAVTEEAILAAYEERFADAEPATEYNAAHLLVETEEDAIAARARIVDGGEAFADVAREVSTGPTGPNGGNLGWFGEGQMVAEFEAAVKSMDKDDVSDPVQTQFGWHVVTLLDTRNKEKPTLDSVRQQIFGELQEAAIQERLAELTDAAEIVQPEDGAFDPAVLGNLELLDD